MLLETMVILFFQLHYADVKYEFIDERGDDYLTVAVSSNDDYFHCEFYLLDSVSKRFAASCDGEFGDSYAYAIVGDNELVDIKRDLFSAADILGQLEAYFESSAELRAFLAEPTNIDLFYEKLYFNRGKFGNTWTVGLQPMFDEFRFDDLFLSMAYVSMLWDMNESTFRIYNGHDFINESSNDLTNGIVTINRKLLFFVLDLNASFSVRTLVPEENSDDYLIYEGTFTTSLREGEEGDYTYCKVTVSELDRFPVSKFEMEWEGNKIEGRTPMLMVVNPKTGIHHASLQEHTIEKAFEEISEFIRKELPAESADDYIERLTSIRDDR